MAEKKGLGHWLMAQRSSSRLAYLLQVGTRVATSFMALIWIRLLVGAMGKPMYGLFLAAQSVFSFGNVGDLGMGGAVGIRVGQYLGAGKEKEKEFQKFLASARTMFLMLSLIVAGGMIVLSAWLPGWLGFRESAGAGSLSAVFRVGAFLMAGVLLASYVNNLSYACGNVTWPIVPAFLVLQLCMLGHWQLAARGQPLWIQYLPYAAASAMGIWLTWSYVKISHRPLARIWPMNVDWPLTLSLFESSIWIYLCMWGTAIYRNTDSMLINAHRNFPLGTLTYYNLNYKFCEIAVFVALTASFVTLPKITVWMASDDPKDQERVRVEMRRLNQFQTLLGCGAALAYLAGNSMFMKIWWMHRADPVAPAQPLLLLAFALNMAVTASGDAGIQLALRSGKKGLRVMGSVIGGTGFLNLGLSLVAMKMDWLEGIALATVVAQSVLSLVASYYICRHLRMRWLPWAVKGWLAPLAGICFAGWLRMIWPTDSASHFFMLAGVYAALLLLAAWGLGVNTEFFREELKMVKKMFGR